MQKNKKRISFYGISAIISIIVMFIAVAGVDGSTDDRTLFRWMIIGSLAAGMLVLSCWKIGGRNG